MYRRSKLGPFWLTLGMAVQITAMGLVFGLIFKSDLQEYLPFLTASIIIWGLLSSTINDGCLVFSSHEAIIKQISINDFVYVIKLIWKNILVWLHNLILLPLIFLIFGLAPNLNLSFLVPGLFLVLANLGWLVWVVGLVSSRYRDMPPIISSIMTVAFYVTPIMWYPNLIEDRALAHLLLGLNPFYHLVQIVRLPLLGTSPTIENWTLALVSAVIGWGAVLVLRKKFKHMIAYWV